MLGKKKAFAAIALMAMSSGAAVAGTEEIMEFSGELTSGFMDFDMNTFGLGSHLDGPYKVTFDTNIPFEGEPIPGPTLVGSQAMATISSNTDLLGTAYSPIDPADPMGMGMGIGMDLNGDGIGGSTFMFDATHGTEYFASVFGFGGEMPIQYNLQITLVPEMETWAMMVAGMGFLGWRLRNKKTEEHHKQPLMA